MAHRRTHIWLCVALLIPAVGGCADSAPPAAPPGGRAGAPLGQVSGSRGGTGGRGPGASPGGDAGPGGGGSDLDCLPPEGAYNADFILLRGDPSCPLTATSGELLQTLEEPVTSVREDGVACTQSPDVFLDRGCGVVRAVACDDGSFVRRVCQITQPDGSVLECEQEERTLFESCTYDLLLVRPSS